MLVSLWITFVTGADCGNVLHIENGGDWDKSFYSQTYIVNSYNIRSE